MHLLTGEEIKASMADKPARGLFVDPLLDPGQIASSGIDLRLGYDFLVGVTTRRPSFDLRPPASDQPRGIASYFQETRRDLGDKFVLYPNQVVLTTTLEYLCVPENMSVNLETRSSLNRLGVHVGTSLQPGYTGCASLELFNHGHTPIELVVGARVVQARIFRLDATHAYLGKAPRKYVANVRPEVSRILEDSELARLRAIWERNSNAGRDID